MGNQEPRITLNAKIPNAESDCMPNSWMPYWAEWQNLESQIWLKTNPQCRIGPNAEYWIPKSLKYFFGRGAFEKFWNLPWPLFRPKFTHAYQLGSNPCRHPVPIHHKSITLVTQKMVYDPFPNLFHYNKFRWYKAKLANCCCKFWVLKLLYSISCKIINANVCECLLRKVMQKERKTTCFQHYF